MRQSLQQTAKLVGSDFGRIDDREESLRLQDPACVDRYHHSAALLFVAEDHVTAAFTSLSPTCLVESAEKVFTSDPGKARHSSYALLPRCSSNSGPASRTRRPCSVLGALVLSALSIQIRATCIDVLRSPALASRTITASV